MTHRTSFASKLGCYYSSDYEPFVYSKEWKVPSSIPVEIRHRMDPVISASEYTRGCSDRYISKSKDATCFGLSKTQQVVIGVVLFAFGVIIIVADVIVVVALCTCCKKALSTKQGQSAGTIPVATPAYPPPAQPAYAPTTQSEYAPPAQQIPYATPAQPMYPPQSSASQYNPYAPNPYGQYRGQPVSNQQGYDNPTAPILSRQGYGY